MSAYDCWENGLWYITWVDIVPDTFLSVPIPYMTATYHNIPQYLDGPYGPLSWVCGHTGHNSKRTLHNTLVWPQGP